MPGSDFAHTWDESLFVLRFYSPVNPMGSCRAQWDDSECALWACSKGPFHLTWPIFNMYLLKLHSSRWHLTLSMLDKISADDRLKFFSQFSQKTGFDILCKLTVCMKCQSLFSGKKWEYHQFVVCWICPKSDKGFFLFVKNKKGFILYQTASLGDNLYILCFSTLYT